MRRIVLAVLVMLVILINRDPVRAGPPLSFKLLATLGHSRVNDVSWSEHYLAVASYAGVWLYDASNLSAAPQAEPQLFEYETAAQQVLFSPDGKLLAVLAPWRYHDSQKQVFVWNVETRKVIWSLSVQSEITSMAFTPDSGALAVVDEKGIVFWAINTGRRGRSLAVATQYQSLAFNRERTLVAVSNNQNAVELWSIETVQRLVTLSVPGGLDAGPIQDMIFTADGKHLLILDGEGQIQLWSGANRLWNLINTYPTPGVDQKVGVSDHAHQIMLSPDGTTAIATGLYGGLWRWSLTGNTLSPAGALPKDENGSIIRLAFSSDGLRYATSAGFGDPSILEVHDVSTFKLVFAVTELPKGSPVFNPANQGQQLAVTSLDRIEIWSLGSQPPALLRTLTVAKQPLSGAAFSPDGTTVAAGSVKVKNPAQGILFRWDAQSGSLLSTWPGVTDNYPQGSGRSVYFSPDGKVLAYLYALDSASCARTTEYLTLWDVSKGEMLSAPALDHSDSVAFSPDGTLVAAGATKSLCLAESTTISLWNLRTKQLVTTLSLETPSFKIAFTPDGKHLVAALFRYNTAAKTGHGELRIWDTTTFQNPVDQTLDTSSIYGLAYSADGTLIFTSDEAGTLYALDSATALTRAKIPAHDLGIRSIVVSQDQHTIATAGYDGTIRLWRIE